MTKFEKQILSDLAVGVAVVIAVVGFVYWFSMVTS